MWIVRSVVYILSSAFVCALSFVGVAGVTPSFSTLQPGQFREIEQDLQVNIVFVGYRNFENVDQSTFLSGLPATYRAIDVSETDYLPGTQIKFAGNKFNFNYRIVNSTQAFEDAYFAYLTDIAVPKPRTAFQELYNQQAVRSRTVGQNYQINSVLAEKWLAENAETMLGVNTRQYTMFFINWFGRPDFRFHVYAKPTLIDPDTGKGIRGDDDHTQKISQGGTPPDDPQTPLGSLHRIWFYDLSAGPEYNSASWNLTDVDFDGDGRPDYRIPPIWEYGNLHAYRQFNTFSADHSLLARFIAINQLFTPSPVYDVALSPPRLPTNIEFNLTLYEGNPARNGLALFTPSAMDSTLTALQPFNHFSTRVRDLPFDGQAKRAFDCDFNFTPCYGHRFPSDQFLGNLFLYHTTHLLQFLNGDADYEIPAFNYMTTDDYLNQFSGGDAMDNHRDGTQSIIVERIPESASAQYDVGLTRDLLHEAGHHLGLWHPHDGFDYEYGLEYGPFGDHFFTWAGDSSSTIMGYLGDSYGFSQFDRDNMARWCTAAYLNQANVILAKILKSPRGNSVSSILAGADHEATNALSSYQQMEYVQAATLAKSAYTRVLTAADSINVPVEPEAWQADYRERRTNEELPGAIDDFGSVARRR